MKVVELGIFTKQNIYCHIASTEWLLYNISLSSNTGLK